MNRNTVSCKHCQRRITSNNIRKHEKACASQKRKLTPEELKLKRQLIAQEARKKISPESRIKANQKISEAHKRGCYDQANKRKRGRPGKPLSEETKRLLSEKAKKSKHRRLQRHTQEYCGVLMDSSWEVKLAIWLDSESIAWVRPDPLSYDGRHYFPDFYLPEFNLYVDTKNDYLIKEDSEKVKRAALQNAVEIIILSKQDLTNLGVM